MPAPTTLPRRTPATTLDEPTLVPVSIRVWSRDELARSGVPGLRRAPADCAVHMAPIVRLEAPPPDLRDTKDRKPRSRLARSMALRNLLVARATFADVEPGSVCGHTNEEALVVVVSGEVELRVHDDEQAVARIGRGEAFGFVPAPRPDAKAVFVALGAARLARVSPSDVHAALGARPELATQIAAAARGWLDVLARLPGYRPRRTTEVRDGAWACAMPPLVVREDDVHEEVTSVRNVVTDRATRSGSGSDDAWKMAETERLAASRAPSRLLAGLRRAALWAAIASGPAVVTLLFAMHVPSTAPEAAIAGASRSPAASEERTVAHDELRAADPQEGRDRNPLPREARTTARADAGHAMPTRRATPIRPTTSRDAREAPRAAPRAQLASNASR